MKQPLVSIVTPSYNQGRFIRETIKSVVDQDYPNIEWRIALARALEKTGRYDEALHEVRICLRLRPHQPEAARLLEELVVRVENIRSKAK